jgi:hypothetical protein
LFQVDVHGINGDPFHVLAYYTTTSSQWRVTKYITCTRRMAYVPQKKQNGKEGSIPPMAVGDLLPTPPNETGMDMFNDRGCTGEFSKKNVFKHIFFSVQSCRYGVSYKYSSRGFLKKIFCHV